MRIPGILALAAAPALLFAAPAAAQYVVLGESHATACYQSALASRTDVTAIEDCDIAIEYETLGRRDRAATYVNRAILRMRRNSLEDALRDLDRAESMRPEFGPTISVNRAALFVRMERFSESVQQADIASAYFNRAVALEHLGDVAGAYRSYQAALTARPGWRLPERELARFTVSPGS